VTSDKAHLRLLPAVDRVLSAAALAPLCQQHSRAVVTNWVRDVLASLRNGEAPTLPADAAAVEALVVERVQTCATEAASQRLRKVINGTGIVIHTNLGRAPLAPATIQAMVAAAECTNVEVDLASGLRGRRGAAVETLCQELTGAEAALVVNNCAAATLLVLQTLAAGREVIISRGQLIEIGGSFRLPDVFREACVTLREVGTTNRTRLADYAAAIDANTAALLRVHPSNYRISGFCESVNVNDLAALGHERGLPVIDDVGSGCLYDLAKHGLPDEPIVSESIGRGADLVLFSGDKLLGGPQCGIIVGRAELVERLRKNPLARALRVDKLTLAGLQATLEIHRSGRAFEEIPVLRQLTLPAEEIRRRAEQLLARLKAESSTPDSFSLQEVASASGGGALPELSVPSWAIAIAASDADRLARMLRLGEPAVLTRIQEDKLLIDLRTVLPQDEERLAQRLRESSSSGV
jgi:L-seryl-tRNA(Ser) seleniumtransferase